MSRPPAQQQLLQPGTARAGYGSGNGPYGVRQTRAAGQAGREQVEREREVPGELLGPPPVGAGLEPAEQPRSGQRHSRGQHQTDRSANQDHYPCGCDDAGGSGSEYAPGLGRSGAANTAGNTAANIARRPAPRCGPGGSGEPAQAQR